MPFLLVIAIVVLGAGVFVHTKQPQEKIAPTPTMSPEPTNVPIPTSMPSPTFHPKPTDIPSNYIDSSTWQYPGSQKTSNTTYVSADEPKVITDWYKAKINALGFQAKSFVTTSANGKILNKLAAAENNSEIVVEIAKNPGETVSTIKVVLDN